MVTEYIKRGQRMGYDQNGTLVYKVPETEPSPLVEDDEDEELPPLNLV